LLPKIVISDPRAATGILEELLLAAGFTSICTDGACACAGTRATVKNKRAQSEERAIELEIHRKRGDKAVPVAPTLITYILHSLFPRSRERTFGFELET
jgi:hypothetical protein